MHVGGGDPDMAVELPPGLEIDFVAESACIARVARDERNVTAAIEGVLGALSPEEIPAERKIGRRGGADRHRGIDVHQIGQRDEPRRGEIAVTREKTIEGDERAATV